MQNCNKSTVEDTQGPYDNIFYKIHPVNNSVKTVIYTNVKNLKEEYNKQESC